MNTAIRNLVVVIGLFIICGDYTTAIAADKKGSSESNNSSSASKKEGLMKGLGGKSDDENLPVYIKSDTVSLDSKRRVFEYRGNVQVTKGDVDITSDSMEGTYDESNKLEKIVFIQNVVLTKAESMRATANRAVYKVKTDTVEMTEAPEVQEKGNALSADKITVYLKEDRSEAEGNVRVKLIKSNESESPFAGMKK